MANISQPLLLMTMLNRKPYQPFPCPCLPWILGNHLGFSSCNPPQSYLQRSFGWEYPYYLDTRLQSVLTFQEEAASCRTPIISLISSWIMRILNFYSHIIKKNSLTQSYIILILFIQTNWKL